jgi:hypothetical protein
MKVAMSVLMVLVAGVLMSGCEPDGQSPGLWLSGTVKPFAEDWRFTDSQGEISIEMSSPYLLPHSVTIWSAQLDGNLYIAAGQAATKNWPGWVDDDPEVRLGIGDRVYEVRLVPITDAAIIAQIREGSSAKSNPSPPPSDVSIRFWQVEPRT